MKRFVTMIIAVALICSCGGRSKEEQKAYTDSLFHVISCSPTIVAGPYTLEDQLNACDLLINEYPNKKDEIENLKETIRKQIKDRDAEFSY